MYQFRANKRLKTQMASEAIENTAPALSLFFKNVVSVLCFVSLQLPLANLYESKQTKTL